MKKVLRKTSKWVFILFAVWIIWSFVGALTNPPTVAGENHQPTFDLPDDSLPGFRPEN